MKSTLRTLSFLSVCLLISSAAYADGQGAARQSCKEDAKTFCSDVKPGGGRIISCLKDHSSELSDGCSNALGKLKSAKGHKSANDSSGDDSSAPKGNDDNSSDPAN